MKKINMLITILVIMILMISNLSITVLAALTQEEIDEFNAVWENYEGNQKGSNIKKLISETITFAESYSGDSSDLPALDIKVNSTTSYKFNHSNYISTDSLLLEASDEVVSSDDYNVILTYSASTELITQIKVEFSGKDTTDTPSSTVDSGTKKDTIITLKDIVEKYNNSVSVKKLLSANIISTAYVDNGKITISTEYNKVKKVITLAVNGDIISCTITGNNIGNYVPVLILFDCIQQLHSYTEGSFLLIEESKLNNSTLSQNNFEFTSNKNSINLKMNIQNKMTNITSETLSIKDSNSLAIITVLYFTSQGFKSDYFSWIRLGGSSANDSTTSTAKSTPKAGLDYTTINSLIVIIVVTSISLIGFTIYNKKTKIKE